MGITQQFVNMLGANDEETEVIIDKMSEKTYQGFYKYGKDGDWVKGQHEPILVEE